VKTWQEPGSDQPAEWAALTDDPDWSENGAVWVHEVEPQTFACVILQPDLEVEEHMHAQARWLDLGKLTLPERQRFGGKELDLLALIQSGWGLPVASHVGASSVHVRSKAKRSALDYKPSVGVTVPFVHHRRWAEDRKEDPVSYMAGFLLGMRRGEAVSGESRAFLSGWRHGWEYAVGRAKLPTWFNEIVEGARK
jgi:hypothetical protein